MGLASDANFLCSLSLIMKIWKFLLVFSDSTHSHSTCFTKYTAHTHTRACMCMSDNVNIACGMNIFGNTYCRYSYDPVTVVKEPDLT